MTTHSLTSAASTSAPSQPSLNFTGVLTWSNSPCPPRQPCNSVDLSGGLQVAGLSDGCLLSATSAALGGIVLVDLSAVQLSDGAVICLLDSNSTTGSFQAVTVVQPTSSCSSASLQYVGHEVRLIIGVASCTSQSIKLNVL